MNRILRASLLSAIVLSALVLGASTSTAVEAPKPGVSSDVPRFVTTKRGTFPVRDRRAEMAKYPASPEALEAGRRWAERRAAELKASAESTTSATSAACYPGQVPANYHAYGYHYTATTEEDWFYGTQMEARIFWPSTGYFGTNGYDNGSENASQDHHTGGLALSMTNRATYGAEAAVLGPLGNPYPPFKVSLQIFDFWYYYGGGNQIQGQPAPPAFQYSGQNFQGPYIDDYIDPYVPPNESTYYDSVVILSRTYRNPRKVEEEWRNEFYILDPATGVYDLVWQTPIYSGASLPYDPQIKAGWFGSWGPRVEPYACSPTVTFSGVAKMGVADFRFGEMNVNGFWSWQSYINDTNATLTSPIMGFYEVYNNNNGTFVVRTTY